MTQIGNFATKKKQKTFPSYFLKKKKILFVTLICISFFFFMELLFQKRHHFILGSSCGLVWFLGPHDFQIHLPASKNKEDTKCQICKEEDTTEHVPESEVEYEKEKYTLFSVIACIQFFLNPVCCILLAVFLSNLIGDWLLIVTFSNKVAIYFLADGRV